MEPSGSFRSIVEDFAFLEDWDERYRYIIELGRGMPAFDDANRTPEYRVEGCVSQVWLVPRVERDAEGGVRVHFDGDSDAHITRGLIAILRTLFSGRTAKEIGAIDAAEALGQLDLSSHISPQRSNGLQAMVKRIQYLAAAAGA